MKFIYKDNPLEVEIVLNDFEKKLLWNKLKIEIMDDGVHDIQQYIHNGYSEDQIDETVKFLTGVDESYNRFIDIETNRRFEESLEALSDNHWGDCVCNACSCPKCYVEDLLEISTTECGKHVNSTIESAFRKYKTIDEAIEYLSEFRDDCPWKDENPKLYADVRDKFIEYNKDAHEYLVKYKEEKFGKEIVSCL